MMINQLLVLFRNGIQQAGDTTDLTATEHGYRVTTAALLVEMIRADHTVTDTERNAVISTLEHAFSLTAAESAALLQAGEAQATDATSLYQFTRILNDEFNSDQKDHFIELMWRMAFADGHLDKYEEHLVRKVADLIHVPHHRFIRAKHRAQECRQGLSAAKPLLEP